MKAKFHEKLTVCLFCGFLAVMMVLYLAVPKAEFSEMEKRELADFPVLNWETLTSGEFTANLETYMADHMPGRNFFVGLHAYYELFTRRQAGSDVYIADGNRLLGAPVRMDPVQVDKNMKYLNRFAENLDIPVDFMIVPSAGFFLGDTVQGLHNAYLDDEIIQSIYAKAAQELNCVDILETFRVEQDPGRLYYLTDHHWTSYGAYRAYEAYMAAAGREAAQQSDFRVETVEGFYGSIYSSSALWLTPSESIEMWHGSPLHVTIGEETYHSPFFLDRLQDADKYTVFLNGNQPLVRIRNEANVGKGKLLVIRDSYANCLGPMLAESYEEVIMIDLRYYRLPASVLCAQEGIDHVLILYSIGNFMTDTNFPYLK